ncbi:MAG: CorA family divalent cation transporter [Stenotrophomonas sp.]
MNFAAMPELHWHYGYAIALAAVAASIVLPLLWFKRRGWL